MLFAALGQRKRPLSDLGSVFADLWSAPNLRSELVELLDVRREQSRLQAEPIDAAGIVPIFSHATYTRYEALAGFGLVSKGTIRESREGPIYSEAHKTDLFFVTLVKDEADFTPSTRYQDYPIAPTLFHWESQSRTATASPTGQRYINHQRLGSRVVFFVRETTDDDRDVSAPFVCLGSARHVSHKSDRPMQIIWELDRPMPSGIYSYAKVAAG
jgi:hypothetical protein